MKIINEPTASYKQCEAWIKSKKTANKLALENLPIMWKCAIKNGIDPVVLIAQSMKETGWYNFGGVVPASYHNPCGLKVTKGGGDYEVGAHMRFKSWEEGIMAQSDHLALYAGGPYVPKYSPDCASHQNTDCMDNGTTKDPRHFTYLFGKCPTVESLGGNWAPSFSYGTDIIKMIKEIYAIEVEEEPVIDNSDSNKSIQQSSTQDNVQIPQVNLMFDAIKTFNRVKSRVRGIKNKINKKR